MLYRKAYDKLLEWKIQPNKKALCVMGARQIGKTTVIRQFGEDQYECFVEINFITDTDAGKIFAGTLDANTIITNLTAYTRKPMIPGKTLVLLDEIQACPDARTAIKFLAVATRFFFISFRKYKSTPPSNTSALSASPPGFRHTGQAPWSFYRCCTPQIPPAYDAAL